MFSYADFFFIISLRSLFDTSPLFAMLIIHHCHTARRHAFTPIIAVITG